MHLCLLLRNISCFLGTGRNKLCESIISLNQASNFYSRNLIYNLLLLTVYSSYQKSDTSRDAFDYADYESVLQVLLSVKEGYQIGS